MPHHTDKWKHCETSISGMCMVTRELHRTNKIEGSFRAVITLKTIFKNNLVF